MFKKVNLSLAGLIIIILIALLAGFISGRLWPKNQDSEPTPSQESHQSGYKYISPLLACSDTKLSGLEDYDLKNNITSLIDKKINSGEVRYLSLYFRDLNNGPWIGINENEKFSPASLLKVPLMMAYLKLAEDDPGILERKIKIEESMTQSFPQNIIPEKKIVSQQEYPVEELIASMIKYSDNTAANALLNNIPAKDLGKIYSDLSIKLPGTDGQENFMTVRDYSAFFRVLYNASYLNREMSEKALSLLTTSTFNNGLVAGLPVDTTVAHKFGERVLPNAKQLHDCGIVYHRQKNYLICIMTRGDDFTKMENTIKDLAALIYKNFITEDHD
jgi:beta-lactamase class A